MNKHYLILKGLASLDGLKSSQPRSRQRRSRDAGNLGFPRTLPVAGLRFVWLRRERGRASAGDWSRVAFAEGRALALRARGCKRRASAGAWLRGQTLSRCAS